MANYSSTPALNNLTSFLASSFNETSTPMTPFLEELLDHLGFEMWESVINTFILPVINLIGIAFCSFSLWIFSRETFEDPIFFYYKLLSFINIIHLLHNIPKCFLFSPLYFPEINSYVVSIYQIYYAVMSNFLFHFEDVLQMGILLHKMKIFSSFVKKHYSASPKMISLAFFITCFVIDFSGFILFKVTSLGNYFYFDEKGIKQTNTFFYYTPSDFSQSLLGKILVGFTIYFLNLFISVLVGVTINIVSYVKYKSHMTMRQREIEQLQISSIHNRPTTNREIEQLKHRERIEHQIERNMFYMSLTLCSISILSRFLIMVNAAYFLFSSSFRKSLISTTLNTTIYTLVPTMSIFVFYSFNKMFRDETKKKLFGKEPRPYPRIIFISNEVHF